MSQQQQVHLIHCSCTVRPSCHAMTLDVLLRCGNVPVVDAFALPSSSTANPSGATNGASSSSSASLVVKPQIPKELWYLTDAIRKYANVPGLFPTEFATEHDALALLETLSKRSACFDNVVVCPAEQCPAGSTSIYSVAVALIVFLRDLQVSVIPSGLLAAAVAASKAGPSAVMKFTMEQLPTAHYNVFLYVMSLLRFLLRPQNAASNELTPQILGQVFAVVLFSLSSQCRPSLGGKPAWFYASSNPAGGGPGSSSLSGSGGSAAGQQGLSNSSGSSMQQQQQQQQQASSGGSHRAQADEEFQCAVNFILSFL